MNEHKGLTDRERQVSGPAKVVCGRQTPYDAYDFWNQRFRLESIRDGAHLQAATAVLDELLAQGQLSADAEAYLGALTDLVETYERVHVTWPEATGIDIVRRLMEENALNQSDLARILDAPRSNVSEVLSGKRSLSKAHVQKLAAHFGLPMDVFLDRQPVLAVE